jgi:hypothetical protein
MIEKYKFINVSGQNYFLTDIKRKVGYEQDKILEFTAEEITQCEFLASLINRGLFIQVDDEMMSSPEVSPEKIFPRETPSPDPFSMKTPPRESIIVDEHPPRNIIVDEAVNARPSIYDDADEIKKNS